VRIDQKIARVPQLLLRMCAEFCYLFFISPLRTNTAHGTVYAMLPQSAYQLKQQK
jgi:hypothetical protein